MMKYYQYLSLTFLLCANLSGQVDFTSILEPPYPPPAMNKKLMYCSEGEFNSVDDIADFELGKPDSRKQSKQEFHRRLLAKIQNRREFEQLQTLGGYLIHYGKNRSVSENVKKKIAFIFDQSMRRMYYACYGYGTLEEAIFDHDELQSSIAKYYPSGIPISQHRLSQYFKALAYGYRPNYRDRIDLLRQERLLVMEADSDDYAGKIKLGNNAVKVILEKSSKKPLAILKPGSDKFHGKCLLVALGFDSKVSDLENAKVEMGYTATWNELLAQALNYLYKGCFLTPTVSRFGNATLHAYQENTGSLSHLIHELRDEFDQFITTLEDSHVQHWGLVQFLMTSSDAHRNNTLVNGKHLIAIDFGRALAPPSTNQLLLNLRTCTFDWPQMQLELSEEDQKKFSQNFDRLLYDYVEGIEKYEPRRCVRPVILKSIEHLHRNLITLRLAVGRKLTPHQIIRLKYPHMGLEDHFNLIALFKTMHGKDPYSDHLKETLFRQTLGKSGIFNRTPFTKAWLASSDDIVLFEYLIDNAIKEIQNTPLEELYSEIQLSWLIRASLIIPIKLESFF